MTGEIAKFELNIDCELKEEMEDLRILLAPVGENKDEGQLNHKMFLAGAR